MEIHKANIIRDGDNATLSFTLEGKTLDVLLTEDKPNEVKSIFNQLLLELKKGEFNFELEDDDEDLYYHISKEYVSQLNVELSSIYNELKDYELTDEEE